jgi:hypothetical protein
MIIIFIYCNRAHFVGLTQIVAHFDVDTDSANGATGCASYWDAATVASFGTGATCAFTDDDEITINLGKGATVEPGDFLTLSLLHDIRKIGETLTGKAANGSVVVLGPGSYPVNPVISVAYFVSTCDSFTISGSANDYGRDLVQYKWVLTGEVNLTSHSKNWAFAAGSLPAGDYAVHLVAENWLHFEATAYALFTVSADAYPTIVATPSYTIYRTWDVTLDSLVSLSDCGSGDLEYYWVTDDGDFDLDYSTEDLLIPAGTLDSDSVYTFYIYAENGNLTNFAEVKVHVGVQAPTINAPVLITIGVEDAGSLEAQYIYKDYPNEVPTITWTVDSLDGVFGSENSLRTNISELAVGTYTATVTLVFSTYGSVSADVSVVVVDGEVVDIYGFLYQINGIFDFTPFITVDTRTTILPISAGKTNLNNVVTWSWSSVPAIEGLVTNQRNLFLPAYSLQPYTNYLFILDTVSETGQVCRTIGRRAGKTHFKDFLLTSNSFCFTI